MALSVMVCRLEGAGVEMALAVDSAVGPEVAQVFCGMLCKRWGGQIFVCMVDRDCSMLAGNSASDPRGANAGCNALVYVKLLVNPYLEGYIMFCCYFPHGFLLVHLFTTVVGSHPDSRDLWFAFVLNTILRKCLYDVADDIFNHTDSHLEAGTAIQPLQLLL
jgi:hypothetical protein